MEKYPKTMELKNGQQISIRPLIEDDLDELVTFFQTLREEDRQFLRINVMKRDEIVRRFSSNECESAFTLLTFLDDKIIAEGSMFRDEFGWKRKLGDLRIVVNHSFQRHGLGSILVRELFLHTLTTDLQKVQAEITDHQASALAAFKRMGFKEETVLTKHVIDVKGNRQNLVVMSLDIEELWNIMEDFIPDRLYVN